MHVNVGVARESERSGDRLKLQSGGHKMDTGVGKEIEEVQG